MVVSDNIIVTFGFNFHGLVLLTLIPTKSLVYVFDTMPDLQAMYVERSTYVSLMTPVGL